MLHQVCVRGLLPWIEPLRLLGPGGWTLEGRSAHAALRTHEAADVDARLHNVGIGGLALEVEVRPPLKRPDVRAARTTDARRRRDTTPGFTRRGTRLDEEGRVSLTPEVLALEIGARAEGRSVVDAGCGAGGSSIGFARGGATVTAIEPSAVRLADARHNAEVYGVAGRIRFVQGDVATALAGRTADILFLDPPWGVDWPRHRAGPEDLPMLQDPLLSALVYGVAPVDPPFAEVWLKLPPSFDVSTLPDGRPEAVYGRAAGDARRVKFLLVRRRLRS